MTKEELLETAKPILFNTEMVQAILNGLKTTTRRCIKAKSKNACGFYVTFRESDDSFTGVYDYDENGKMFESPQTQPAYKGDILYVRESWSWCPCWDCGMETDDGKCADPNGHRRYNSEKKEYGCYYFKASAHAGEQPPGLKHWKPSIHMPKEEARIFLLVTNVRVEKVQDVVTGDYRTPGNINAEGLYKPCEKCMHHNGDCKDFIRDNTCRLVNSFAALWNGTVSRSDLEVYGWAANPWVWVIEFERIKVD